jgi:hypothetical protein
VKITSAFLVVCSLPTESAVWNFFD